MRRFARFLERESAATGLPLRSLLVVALVLHLITSVVVINPVHFDEHFQILEFAHARLGLSPVEALPWEFEERIRPTL